MSKPKTEREKVIGVLRELFDERLAKEGIEMSKQISSGSSGLFSYSSPTYDTRKVFNREDLQKLNKEGFGTEDDLGNWIFNLISTKI